MVPLLSGINLGFSTRVHLMRISKGKDLVYKDGLMVLYMTVCGEMIRLMARESLFILMETIIRETGLIIRLKGSVDM